MRWLSFLTVLLVAAGCSSVESRLQENPSMVARLDADTLARIRRGEIAPGDTEDAVRLAFGNPQRVAPSEGGATWFYRDRPRDPNDYVAGGFRHYVEFDPVVRANVSRVEPVGDRLYPQLRTHTTRVSFRAGRVVDVKTSEDP